MRSAEISRFFRAGRPAFLKPSDRALSDGDKLDEIDRLTDAWRSLPKRNARINGHIRRHLSTAGITGGKVLEIGARDHPRTALFASPHWAYTVLDLDDVGVAATELDVVIGDITDCPEIESATYDVVVSVDVFEHVRRPWSAADEITRLLRPGGLSYTSTLFSWRYHPVPVDYWRFTPECLEFLFGELETIEAEFDTAERRRDIRGHGRRDRVQVDALGGWRENWRVTHVGRKPA
jgi:SAM-dependent methyltransferase